MKITTSSLDGQDICVPSPPNQQRFCRVSRTFRTLNGSCNNLRTNFLFGAAGVPFIRLIQGSQGNSNGLFQGWCDMFISSSLGPFNKYVTVEGEGGGQRNL